MEKKRSRTRFLGDRILDLEAYICIQTEKIAPQHAIVRGIEFQLTPERLERVQLAKSRGETLQFKSSFLTKLRNYAISESTLAFATTYGENAIAETVMRSLISLDGEMTHQVCRHWLEDAELALKISSCHHWLIQQVLRGLYFRPVRSLDGVAWGIVALIAVGIVALNWQNFLAASAIAWLVLFLILWLVQRAIAFILNRLSAELRRWLLHQMLFGAFSRDRSKRKRALAILGQL